jgi:hypothetical protein
MYSKGGPCCGRYINILGKKETIQAQGSEKEPKEKKRTIYTCMPLVYLII